MTKKQIPSRALPVPASRLIRSGRLGGMSLAIAGNMAANGVAQIAQRQQPNMRDLLLTPTNIRRITDQLAKMRGAAMKIGQLMSMDQGEVLPPELAQIMARLRDDAHFMPPAQLKKVLSAAWPAGWLQAFRAFDVHPIAAASIGQVHRAQLKDGRELAIKVQYPGVAKSIDSDVANVGALMRMSGLMPKGFELAPYLEKARVQLHEETDYEREGACLSRFGDLLSDDPRYFVPRVQEDWCAPNILAMSFVDGGPIEKVAESEQSLRNDIAARLIELTLKELFSFGVMQTDPNFANYQYDAKTGRIVLLDFGATQDIAPDVVDQYRRIMRFGLDDDVDGIATVSAEIGFFDEATTESHRYQIVEMIRLVFSTLKENASFDFANNDLSRKMQIKGQALAESGFVPPPLPLDVLLLQRKFGGMFLLAKTLRARVDVVAAIKAHLS